MREEVGDRPTLLATAPRSPPELVLALPPPRPTSVVVLGDSVPDWLLRDAAPAYARTDVVVINAAHEGCDGAVSEPMAHGARGEKLLRKATCQAWPDAYPAVVENRSQPVDIALLMIGEATVLSHLIAGHWVNPCDDMQRYTLDVEARIEYLKQHVRAVIVALPAWVGNRASWFHPPDHEARYACVRDQLRAGR